MTIILDGKKLREKILTNLKAELDKLEVKPSLAVILAGDNPASKIYVNNKKKIAEQIGINSTVIKLDENVTEDELIQKIHSLNIDPNVNAILVQLPLPAHISKERILGMIDPKKDVDGLSPYNFGKLFSGAKPYVYPCTPKGVLLLLDEYNI